MNNLLTYKGYTARIEFDGQDRIFYGRIVGIVDLISFDASTVKDLEHRFHQAVDNYLAACKKLGQDPNIPCSGKLMLRVPPEVHRRALARAQAAGKSLNQWAAEALAKAE